MKKLFVALAALAFISSMAVAAGSDTDKLYKTRCIGCHGIDGTKKAPGSNVVLKGQSAAQLREKLMGYKAGSYGGTGKRIMESQVKSLDEAQVKDMSEYVAGF